MMPNKTIYVSEADLPILEKAQELAGDNLSTTIVQALRQFIESQEQELEGFHPITVKVGKSAYSLQRFTGRLLAKGHYTGSRDKTETYKVFQTQKGKFALYIRKEPNRSRWPKLRSKTDEAEGSDEDGQDWHGQYILEVFDSVEALKERISDDLYRVVRQRLAGVTVEDLDI